STTSTTTAAPTTQVTTAVPTTTSSSSGSEKVFQPVDGGSDRVCRGSTPSDNKPGYYFVVTVASLDGCKSECVASSDCVGLEYKGSRCEIWTRSGGIQASRESSGYTCLSYGVPATLRPGSFEAVDGGDARVCRGASATDNQPSYFRVLQGTSLESCQRQCQISDDCVGVEHHQGGRCELWTRALGIQASKPLQGYSCWRFVPEGAAGPTRREGDFEAVDGAVGRVCRGASPGDNAASYFDVVSGLPSLLSCQAQRRVPPNWAMRAVEAKCWYRQQRCTRRLQLLEVRGEAGCLAAKVVRISRSQELGSQSLVETAAEAMLKVQGLRLGRTKSDAGASELEDLAFQLHAAERALLRLHKSKPVMPVFSAVATLCLVTSGGARRNRGRLEAGRSIEA
ncbi:unnamed protein product, partial [Symbiodinium sp. CCMP2456]